MVAQVHNDADGWDAVGNAPRANAEPADPAQIKGNFTKEEIQSSARAATSSPSVSATPATTTATRSATAMYMSYDHYRKALTSYGPHTADYMVTRLVRMAAALQGGAAARRDTARRRSVALPTRRGRRQRRGPLGRASSAAYDACYATLPTTRASRVLTQPNDITRFDAATVSWRGGNNDIDQPTCASNDESATRGRLTPTRLVQPVRTAGTPLLDVIGPMPYPVVNTLLDGAFPKGARNYWKSAFFKELSADVIGLLVDAFERVPSPMSGLVIEHFHGAVTRVDPTATAYPHREPGFNLVLLGEWLDPADDAANIAWVRSTFDAVAPYTSDAVYVNYLGGDEPDRVRNAYGPNWERLVTLKRRWDPDNVFHLNQNIDPAG